jgi:hypothetical protein
MLEDMRKSQSIADWEKFFSLSLLGKVDREYKELKKLISTARNTAKK